MSFTFEQQEILREVSHQTHPENKCYHDWSPSYSYCVKCARSMPTYMELLEALESKINQLEMKRKDD